MKKKKILLIQAISMEGMAIERVYPIGIVTLASIINTSAQYAVSIFDMNMSDNPYGELITRIKTQQPDILGISLRNLDPLGNRTTSLMVPFAITLDFIKQAAPDTPLLAGGTGFSLFPERIMSDYPQITCGIAGEAENNILPLLDHLEAPPEIPGIICRVDGRIRLTPPTGDYDMGRYSVPDRDLLDPRPYLAVNHYVESIGVEAKRGCCYHCGYCSYPLLQGSCMRCRDPKAVVDEIVFLEKTYGISRIHFTDSIVNYPSAQLDAICEELLRRNVNIKWSGFFREDLFTPENARLYARSGCECFSLSPDGLCQQHLDTLHKHLKTGDILRTAGILSDIGITTVYHYLVNVPGESEATVAASKEMIDAIYRIHRGSKSIGTLVLNLIRIMPRTAIEKLALADGTISPQTDLLYPVFYDPPAFRTLRYELEVYHQKQNIAMWNNPLAGEGKVL
ncbi:MAG: B12 lower ligand biosynthesis radical SAM protein BzaD [Eubacteriaceae bacterium]|nr:B12 lower ligand biosynthesis radical SAM protein BzaD [Eubacteriaceae bacterium]